MLKDNNHIKKKVMVTLSVCPRSETPQRKPRFKFRSAFCSHGFNFFQYPSRQEAALAQRKKGRQLYGICVVLLAERWDLWSNNVPPESGC